MRPRTKKPNCLNCGKEVSRRPKIYCDNNCQQEYQHKQTILEWKETGEIGNRPLKRYLIETHGNRCSECGIEEWNGKPIVMDLEHKDGDSSNNSEENVCLLCPNCHSQTPTYKGANKGNGRHYRRERYKQGKSY